MQISDGIEESMNKEAVEVSSVLSASASIVSHCLSKHYNLVNPGCEDYRCWLAMLTSLCQQLEPPYELEVCDTFVTGFAVVSVFNVIIFFSINFIYFGYYHCILILFENVVHYWV